jgi:hypothetical protein
MAVEMAALRVARSAVMKVVLKELKSVELLVVELAALMASMMVIDLVGWKAAWLA